MKKIKASKERISVEIVLLMVIIILAERCFYLIDIDKISIPGIFNYYDISLFICIVWSVYVMLKYKYINIKYNYKYSILFVIILAIISSVRSNQLYGQSISLGIRPQRFFIILMLMYFPFVKFLSVEENRIKIIKVIYKLGILELGIFIFQYLISNKILFLHVVTSQRYGGTRLHFEAVLLSILFFISLNNYLNGKNKIKNIVLIIMLIFYNVFIIRGRLALMGLVISFGITVLLWRKNRFLKYCIVICGVLVFIIGVNTSILGDYVNSVTKNSIQYDANSQIRKLGKEYYKDKLSQSPLLGRGYINELNKEALLASGAEHKYLLVDNGVVAFAFMYGLIGIIWLGILFYKIFRQSVNAYVKNNNYMALSYVIYLIAISTNILEFYWKYGPLYFVIIIALLENSGRNNKENFN